jgi:hypothetical protein
MAGTRIVALPPMTEAPALTDVLPIHNASTGDTEKVSIQQLVGFPDYGWSSAVATWSYSSWSATTRIGVITIPSDGTTVYTPGMRVKITQSTGGTKYGIIVAVSATTLTVFFPNGTTLNNEAISTPFYSSVKTPFGFPSSPTLWDLSLTSANDRTVSGAGFATLTDSLVVGIGAWKLKMKVTILRPYSASTSNDYYRVTLSSTTTTETDPEMTVHFNLRFGSSSASSGGAMTEQTTEDVLLASQTTYTLLGKKDAGVNGTVLGSAQATVIRAICGYL